MGPLGAGAATGPVTGLISETMEAGLSATI